MCKNIQSKFIIFKTNDGKIHLANGFSSINSKFFNLVDFITDIDKEHVKYYIYKMFKNRGHIDGLDIYTDMRNCRYNVNDFRYIITNGKPIYMIADNNGFYGFPD